MSKENLTTEDQQTKDFHMNQPTSEPRLDAIGTLPLDEAWLRRYRTAAEIMWWFSSMIDWKINLEYLQEGFTFRAYTNDHGERVSLEHCISAKEMDDSFLTSQEWAMVIARKALSK